MVFGGLSRNDLGYLNAYYSAAGGYSDAASKSYFFDVMGVHPYSSVNATTPEEPISPDRNTSSAEFSGTYGTVDQNFLGIKRIKSAMDAKGDTGKLLYLGEYGFSTTTTFMQAVPGWQRALYLKRAYMLARDLPYVKGMSWFAYHPSYSVPPEWTILSQNDPTTGQRATTFQPNQPFQETMTFRALKQVTGAETGGAIVTLSPPGSNCSVSRTYKVDPTTTNMGEAPSWDLYVDGVRQTSYGNQVPFNWNTTTVGDGDHALMVVAYPQQGSQAGSVWPSNMITLTVDNATNAGSGASLDSNITVGSLCTNASSYTAGSQVLSSFSISANTATTVEALSIGARPKGSTDSSLYVNFNYLAPYTIGTTPTTVTGGNTISRPGTYVLWVSYKKNGSWYWLLPEREFTVR